MSSHICIDHIGNIGLLSPNTQIVLAEAETLNIARTGRLPQKLPKDNGRIQLLTARGDIGIINTPGHVVGHSSVLVDLGEEQVLLAGDCAFDDQQAIEGAVPGITENLSLLQQTHAKLRSLHVVKPTTMLFTHDWANHEKLISRFPTVGGDMPSADGQKST